VVLVLMFCGLAAVVAVVARRRLGGRGPSWLAVAGTFLVLMLATAVFDNLMIAAGLVVYDEHQLLGLHLGRAPLEDLGYPLATALLLPALWHLLGAARATDVRRPDASHGSVADRSATPREAGP
jgi:lycopene cyclase domain-containing protein